MRTFACTLSVIVKPLHEILCKLLNKWTQVSQMNGWLIDYLVVIVIYLLVLGVNMVKGYFANWMLHSFGVPVVLT